MNLSELTPDPRNANKGTERGRDALEHSLRSYGAGRSILLDKHGTIIAGNKTAETAADIGIDEVVVVETDGNKVVAVKRTDLDLAKDPAARELAYADNRVSELDLDFDPEAILTDLQEGVSLENLWSQAELDQMLKDLTPPTDAPEAQTDRAAELQEKWQTERGQVWEIGRHRLMCGDCRSKQDAGKVTKKNAVMMVTDPPYCSGGWQEAQRAGGTWGNIANDALSSRGWNALMSNVLESVSSMAAYVFTDWRMWVMMYDLLESKGLPLRQMIVWDKGNPGLGNSIWRGQHELVAYGTSQKAKPIDGVGGIGNVIQCDRTGNNLHQTEKPVELITKIISADSRSSTRDGIAIYDPFLGSGTTMVAAEQLNRTCYGMEISPAYCDVIVKRWENLTGEEATR